MLGRTRSVFYLACSLVGKVASGRVLSLKLVAGFARCCSWYAHGVVVRFVASLSRHSPAAVELGKVSEPLCPACASCVVIRHRTVS